jgi:DNA-binding MarR family transcriptional regulator
MTARQQSRHRHAQDDAQDYEWPEKLTVAQAHKFLGVSPSKMTQLLRRNLIETYENPLDRREKLIKRADLEAFLKEYGHD